MPQVFKPRVRPSEKRCSRCGTVRLAREFSPSKQTPTLLDAYCRHCRREIYRLQYQSHRQRFLDGQRERGFKWRTGMTRARRAEILREQGHKCAICSALDGVGRAELVVDHDHATGRFRALICHRCNTGIGLFMDDPALLALAIAYLSVHSNAVSDSRSDAEKAAGR